MRRLRRRGLRVVGEEREERVQASQAFVHFSRFVRVAKWVGLIALNREGSPSATRSHVCVGCARSFVRGGYCGESRAMPPSSSSSSFVAVVCRLLCVKTATDPVKSGVEGFAERMERSRYFGKLSGRHERRRGADAYRRRVPLQPINRPTLPQFRRWPRKRYTEQGARICSPPPPPPSPGDFLRWLFPSFWLSGLSSPFLSGRWSDWMGREE